MGITFKNIPAISGIRVYTAGAGPAPVYDASYVLSLAAVGVNNQSNSVFKDYSTHNATITRYGNSTQGTFTPYSRPDGYWAVRFNGSTDCLSFVSSPDFNLTSNFTIEAFITPRDISGTYTIAARHAATGEAYQLRINNGAVQFVVQTSTTPTTTYATTSVLQAGRRTHVAVVRQGDILKIFVDGVSLVSNAITGTITPVSRPLTVGCLNSSGTILTVFYSGIISNFRLVNGTAVYTTNFVPSTTPLTAVGGTVVLTCRSRTFADNSSAQRTITAYGTPAVIIGEQFGFGEYDASAHGGSAYFDGTGDYITAPPSSNYTVGTQDWTAEFWVYRNSTSLAGAFSQWVTGGQMIANITASNAVSVVLQVSGNGYTMTTTTSRVLPFSWNHVAIVRSGTTVKVYVNGIADATVYNIGTAAVDWYGGQLKPFIIGAGGDAGNLLNGYISDLRFTVGTALYTSDFAVPDAPLPAHANTRLLMNFTNAGIIDETRYTDLETVGDARVTNSVVRPGKETSIYLDGTGDYLKAPNSNQQYTFGTVDFTVECWVNRLNRTQASQNIVSVASRIATNGNPVGYGWALTGGATTQFKPTITVWNNNSTSQVSATATNELTFGEWHHIAGVRSGNQLLLFVDGVLSASAALTSGFTVTPNPLTLMNIGTNANGIDSNYFGGYIDSIKVTKGLAKYTSNFTPV